MQSLMSHALLWSGLLRKSSPWYYNSLFGFSGELLGFFLFHLRRRALLVNLPLDGRHIEGTHCRATPTTVVVPRPGEALPAPTP